MRGSLLRRSARFFQSSAAVSGSTRMASGLKSETPPARIICNDFLRVADAPQHLYLIVLNNTLPRLAPQLWEKAAHRICADGGANHLYDELPRMLTGSDEAEVRRRFVPQLICGDLDSIRDDVRSFYSAAGVATLDLSDDQVTTDFEKCLQITRTELMARRQALLSDKSGSEAGACADDAASTVVVLGAVGGRLDHILSHLSVLYANPDLPILLLGDGNAVRLLPRGKTVITVDFEMEGPHCGVVPVGPPARVTSRGLRWDMDDLQLQFGQIISTSNQFKDNVITVECSEPCLWITSLRDCV